MSKPQSRNEAIETAQQLVRLHGISARELLALERSVAGDRRKRAKAAIRIARQICEYWDVQPEELQGVEVRRAPVSVKYEHPITGDRWYGEGDHPVWLRNALLKEGYRLDELRPGSEAFARARDQRARSG